MTTEDVNNALRLRNVEVPLPLLASTLYRRGSALTHRACLFSCVCRPCMASQGTNPSSSSRLVRPLPSSLAASMSLFLHTSAPR